MTYCKDFFHWREEHNSAHLSHSHQSVGGIVNRTDLFLPRQPSQRRMPAWLYPLFQRIALPPQFESFSLMEVESLRMIRRSLFNKTFFQVTLMINQLR